MTKPHDSCSFNFLNNFVADSFVNITTDEGHKVATGIHCSSQVRDCGSDICNCIDLKIISINYGNSNVFKTLTNYYVNHGFYTNLYMYMYVGPSGRAV